MQDAAIFAPTIFTTIGLLALLIAHNAVADTAKDALVLYVSTNGNDSWSGRMPDPVPDGSDGPFATITRAQAEVRKLRQLGNRSVTVFIRGGLYEIEEPLVFTPDDGGAEDCPVRYAAYPGEKPVISGGSKISGWIKGEGSIWQAHISAVEKGSWYFQQLFADGERQTRARMPNEGYLHIAGTIRPLLDREKARRDREYKIGFRYREGDLDGLSSLEDVNIFLYHSWTCSLHWIESLDRSNRTVRFTNPCAWPVGYWDPEERYHLENFLEALDSPGEWYLDRRTGILYFWPPDGQDPNHIEIVAPRLRHLLLIQGKAGEDGVVQNLHFRGLSFMHADWHVEKDQMADGQAATFLSAAIVVTGARNCSFEDCEVAHVGEYGIILGEGCKRNLIARCEIHDLGGGGIRIGQTILPDHTERQTDHNTVDNCFIHDGGHVFRAGIGIWIGKSSYNTITHNEICDFYYSGVSVGWSWGYAPSSAHHNVIEYNHIHNLGKGVLSDMGGIYTLGVSPGTVERFNLIHDVYSYSYGGWGLYTDEGSSYILLEGNIVYNTKSGSFHQHYGRENVLRNNILGPALEATIIRSREEDHISFTMEYNIIFTSNGRILGGSWKNGNYRMDYNLYWDTCNVLGEDMDFGGMGFGSWQKRGKDTHSVVADPLFANWQSHDYTLDEASPSLKLGFNPPPIESIGLYGDKEWVDAPKKIQRSPMPEFQAPPLVQDGPTWHPSTLSELPRWLIKYDPATGRIPSESPQCTLVWHINCRDLPSARPAGSEVDGSDCLTPMRSGLDGLWYAVIPPQDAGALCFRFKNGFSGEVWDDNDGNNWWVVSDSYLEDLVRELQRVIERGTKYGADMSRFEELLKRARSLRLQGMPGSAMNELCEALPQAGLVYAQCLLNNTSERVEALRGRAIDLSLDDRLLSLARMMIEKERYKSAEEYCASVLRHISRYEKELSGGSGSMLVLFALLLANMARPRP